VSLSSTTGSTANLSNHLIQASAFAGAATGGHATQNAFTYTFPAKLTAPAAFSIRATDSDGVSSAGYAEGSINLRSGRLQLSNAFGSEKSNLVVPVQVQYWNGKAWARNTLDQGCTIIPAGAVARSNYLDAKGAAAAGGTAWTTAVTSNVVMSSGRADLVLQAPTLTSGTGTAAGTVDVAINLGDTNVDNACMGAHPTAAIGGLSWLRSPNGSCSSGNVDPSARMSFGVFKPETQKIIHVQDRY
jgi:MSHA biogenesis protein MshQ